MVFRTAARRPELRDGRLRASTSDRSVRTDSKGPYRLPPRREPYSLVAIADEGFVRNVCSQRVAGRPGAVGANRPWLPGCHFLPRVHNLPEDRRPKRNPPSIGVSCF